MKKPKEDNIPTKDTYYWNNQKVEIAKMISECFNVILKKEIKKIEA